MTLPPDLSEGWWWIKWEDGRSFVARIYSSDILRAWMVVAALSDFRLDEMAHRILAMEPVAPPSWETPDA